MKAFLAVTFALLASTAFAAPAGYSRPGGYFDQVKAGSLSKPVDACPIPYAERVSPGVCSKPLPPAP